MWTVSIQLGKDLISPPAQLVKLTNTAVTPEGETRRPCGCRPIVWRIDKPQCNRLKRARALTHRHSPSPHHLFSIRPQRGYFSCFQAPKSDKSLTHSASCDTFVSPEEVFTTMPPLTGILKYSSSEKMYNWAASAERCTNGATHAEKTGEYVNELGVMASQAAPITSLCLCCYCIYPEATGPPLGLVNNMADRLFLIWLALRSVDQVLIDWHYKNINNPTSSIINGNMKLIFFRWNWFYLYCSRGKTGVQEYC